MTRIEIISQLICAAADSGYCKPEDFATLFDSIELHDAYIINDHDLTRLAKYYTGCQQNIIYRRKSFVKRLMEINNNK